MQSAETQYEAVDPYCEYWVYVLCAVMDGFATFLKFFQKGIDKRIYMCYYNEVEFPKTVGTNV